MASELSVSWDEITSFRDRHFSPAAQLSFFSHFIPENTTTTEPTATEQHVEGAAGETENYDDMDYTYGEQEHEEEGEEEEGDDDLGYYPDGVKRTLTDAQISIFRHSEIQEMLKAKRKALLAAEAAAVELAEAEADAAAETEEMEGRANITEDYSTHDRRSRPIQDETGALPWDDEDVEAWQDDQQQEQRDPRMTKGKGKEVPAVARKPIVKPTYDAPSGKQFFWPVIGK